MQFFFIFPTFNTADTEDIKYLSRIYKIMQQKKNMSYNSIHAFYVRWLLKNFHT